MGTNDLTATEAWVKFTFTGGYLDNATGLVQAAKQELSPAARATHRAERHRGTLTDCHRGLCGVMKRIRAIDVQLGQSVNALDKAITTSHGPAPIWLQPGAMPSNQPTLPTSTQSHK